MSPIRTAVGVFLSVIMLLLCSNANAFSCDGNARVRNYVIQKGDTLSELAQSFHTSVNKLKKANHLKSDKIYAERRLIVCNLQVRHHVALRQVSTRVVAMSAAKAQLSSSFSPVSYQSEIVVTAQGPVHVLDGLNLNSLSAEVAIQKLFPAITSEVAERLSQEVRANNYTIIGLQVGDSLQSMLTAEGGIFVNVLQGQRSDSVLPAKCFAVVNDDEHMLLLIREVRSNNWYGETFPVQAEDDNGCIRPRKRGKTS